MTVEPFSITPKAAVDFFKQKGLKPTFAWQDMLHEEHSRNFTVAKMLDMALLKDVHDAVEDAVSKGMTMHQFRERIEPLMQEKGWWGRKEMVDPETGEVIEAQLGSPSRLRTIFETNMKTAFAAGRWDQIKETAEMLPYLVYTAVKDNVTRDEHMAWDGLVLRWDDDFWKTHYPPNGWNCRCSVIQVSERTMKEMGKDSPNEAPKSGSFTWTNPRTGEEMEIPDGIDPGWAYNPGEGRDLDGVEALLDKIGSVPPDIGAEAWDSTSEDDKEKAAESFTAWVDEITRSGKQEGMTQPVGVIDPDTVSEIENAGTLLASALITVTDRVLLHMTRDAKLQKAVDIAQIKQLPQIIETAQTVLFDMQDPALLYLFDLDDDDDRIGKFVVRVNVKAKVKGAEGKKTKVTTNAVVTGGKLKPADLSGNRYRPVKGKL